MRFTDEQMQEMKQKRDSLAQGLQQLRGNMAATEGALSFINQMIAEHEQADEESPAVEPAETGE